MKLHRFFITEAINKKKALVDDALAHQLKKVLRMKSGNTVVFFDTAGNEYTAAIKGISGATIEYEIIHTEKKMEEGREVHLFVSIIKRENFEWVVQKATECGVTSITPLRTERTIKMDLKTERLKKIIKEAAEQSGRGRIPELFPIRSFDEAILNSNGKEMAILCDASGGDINRILEGNKDVKLFVGPEGGWTENELEIARKSNIFIAHLGTFTLRAETAAVIATYISVNGNKNK